MDDLGDFATWVSDQIPYTGETRKARTPESFDISRMMQTGFVSLRLAQTREAYAYGVSGEELRYTATLLGKTFAKILLASMDDGQELIERIQLWETRYT